MVIKPDWVEDRHARGGEITSMVTHSAVLRAVVDPAFATKKGRGEIVLADAPVWGCNFTRLMELTQVGRIPECDRKKHRFEIAIVDLRHRRHHRGRGRWTPRADGQGMRSSDGIGEPRGERSRGHPSDGFRLDPSEVPPVACPERPGHHGHQGSGPRHRGPVKRRGVGRSPRRPRFSRPRVRPTLGVARTARTRPLGSRRVPGCRRWNRPGINRLAAPGSGG